MVLPHSSTLMITLFSPPAITRTIQDDAPDETGDQGDYQVQDVVHAMAAHQDRLEVPLRLDPIPAGNLEVNRTGEQLFALIYRLLDT